MKEGSSSDARSRNSRRCREAASGASLRQLTSQALPCKGRHGCVHISPSRSVEWRTDGSRDHHSGHRATRLGASGDRRPVCGYVVISSLGIARMASPPTDIRRGRGGWRLRSHAPGGHGTTGERIPQSRHPLATVVATWLLCCRKSGEL